MTISITQFQNLPGPIALSLLDQNFTNIVAAVDANTVALAAAPIPFVPGITFGGAAVGLTYSGVRAGAYVLVGNLVYFSIDVKLTAKGSSTGVAAVTGLPFTPSSAFPSSSAPVVAVALGTTTFAAGYVVGLISGTTILLLNTTSGGGFSNPLNEGNFSNTSEVNCSGFYVKA